VRQRSALSGRKEKRIAIRPWIMSANKVLLKAYHFKNLAN
jgi:hypothetical protein